MGRGEAFLMSEAKFVISHNFTTIRGDTYEEFVANLTRIYGEADGQSLAAIAFSELRNHYLGIPSELEAQRALQAGLGATAAGTQQQYQQPTTNATQGAPAGQWIALDIPFAQKDLAKSSGGKWDKDKKAWTFPPGHALISQFPEKR